jgi:hypothetical protein
MIDEAIEIGGTDFVVIPEFSGVRHAKGLDARMLQLRAATRLSHLWRAQGKAAEASRPLRTIYETFTEGFATADLREASDLLSSLP